MGQDEPGGARRRQDDAVWLLLVPPGLPDLEWSY